MKDTRGKKRFRSSRLYLSGLIVLTLSVMATIDFEGVYGEPLPGTDPLEMEGDIPAQMVAGIGRYLQEEIEQSRKGRDRFWNRDFSSPENYTRSVEPNRKRFAKILGVVEERKPVEMSLVVRYGDPERVSQTEDYEVYAVRWSVLEGVHGEGLLLVPNKRIRADVVALPDCDQTPEMLVGLEPGLPREARFADALACSGCRVLIPFLINRRDTYSGNPKIRMTNQPHREFIYRGAYQMGRHIIGYEVEKVLSAVDWFQSDSEEVPVGVFGYGEGGLLAFYAAAVDPRIDSVCVSGYFGPREEVWREPIYRNIWSLLHEFGDAEIATLIAPRALTVECCQGPEIEGPPPERDGRSGAAPGLLKTPDIADVRNEFNRATDLLRGLAPEPDFRLVENPHGLPGSLPTLTAFLESLDVHDTEIRHTEKDPADQRHHFDPEKRLKCQFDELVEYNQYLMRKSPEARAKFWSDADASNLDSWIRTTGKYREYFREEVIGTLPERSLPLNPKTRLTYDTPTFKGYEVTLDVFPEVFAYGILLVPKNMKQGERRPVVVCQHGLESRVQEVADPSIDNHYYHRFACRLAEQGFVTFAPQNPYIGGDKFRVLQRMANPLKLSLFSFITRQHEAILEWLKQLPFIDPKRIGFYGLSYGGKTAMRVPVILKDYCLSICSGDFNEWIWKTVSYDHKYSYLFTGEYEMFEFGIGETFNYAELAGLICPRPFMVERGHGDGVAPDEWVGYEFTRAFQRYDLLGLGDRIKIEFFDGPHTIHGVGTFEFLHKWLEW